MKASKFLALACVLASNLVFAQSGTCVGKVVVSTGAYGAINFDAFDELRSAQQDGDQAKIRALVARGFVFALPAHAVACVTHVNGNQESRTITVPGIKVAVLVSNEFLANVGTE